LLYIYECNSFIIDDFCPAQGENILMPCISNLNFIMDDPEFAAQHKATRQAFTRDRFFTFRVLLIFLMTNLQKGIQREIALFKDAIELDGGSIPEVSKAAFCKARKKLKHTAFTALSECVCKTFYQSRSVQRWHGYRVIAVDGSTVELPNSPQIQKQYGVFKHRADGKAICMARTLMVYDTLNHMTLAGTIDSINKSETVMLWEALPGLDLKKDDLLVFDRCYASHLLFFYLNKRGVPFCFRMKKDWWKVVENFYNSGAQSSLVTLTLPAKDKPKAAELELVQTSLTCRLTRIELESGETEILLTSLTDQDAFSVADTTQLYNLRWPIENAYKTFKHKVCIENFSGKSVLSVLQDFYVKIFIMNLTAIGVRPINKALQKPSVKVKHTRQVNLIEAVATMKRAVVSFFLTKNISKALKRFYERSARITEPIRPGRKYKRNHQPKRKHYQNYKPV
jgi:Transposase DDE domain